MRCPTRTSPTGTRRRSTTTAPRSSSPTSGAAARSARCRVTDQPEWGADALFDIVDGQMEFASYYKMPAVQTVQENCVAHNSSLVPVPGRDILVQAWYQGGLSVIDFSDTANPIEIAFFDRGPINSRSRSRTRPTRTGSTSVGCGRRTGTTALVFGTEIARGFDTFGLMTSDQMSENEIGAASEVHLDRVQRPAPERDHLGAELQRRRLLLRPGGPVRRARRRDARPRWRSRWRRRSSSRTRARTHQRSTC